MVPVSLTRALIGGAVSLALAGGCAGQLADTVRARAAAEFPCAKDELTVTPGDEGWTAEGCGKTDTYVVRCVGLGMSCTARNSSEQREYEEARAELKAQHSR